MTTLKEKAGHLLIDQIRSHRSAALVIMVLMACIVGLIVLRQADKRETRERETRQELLAIEREKRQEERISDCNEALVARFDELITLLKK